MLKWLHPCLMYSFTVIMGVLYAEMITMKRRVVQRQVLFHVLAAAHLTGVPKGGRGL